MKLQRLDTGSGRFYFDTIGTNPTVTDGTFFIVPSVTTVLGQIPSQRLEELRQTIGDEELNKIGKRATRRGTAMHSFLENYFICLQKTSNPEKSLLYTQKKTPLDLRNDDIPEESIIEGRNLFYNYYYEGQLDRISRVYSTEQFVWSIKHKYAGTLDFCFVNQNNRLVIADFKSANGIKDEETIHKYFLQLAAYTIAFEELFNRKISHTELWISNRHGMQERILEGSELTNCKEEYIHWVENFHKNWNPEEIISTYYKR
ncbi:hypothetical protein EBU94_01200 [bacterium]|nr:hypothetical protein [bacterium]